MAIGAGSLIEVTIGGEIHSSRWMNVWTFRVVGELGSPSPAEWGNAIWNGLKTPYRALVATPHTSAFQYVKVREMDSVTGEYGEFSIPTAEQAGTGGTSTSLYLPMFNAAGIRFTVSTRLTRPGQKRIPGARGEDLNSYTWVTTYKDKITAFAQAALDLATLGAPALGSEVQLVIVSIDSVTGLPTAHQDVTGFLVNPEVTSQVSRKKGVGI